MSYWMLTNTFERSAAVWKVWTMWLVIFAAWVLTLFLDLLLVERFFINPTYPLLDSIVSVFVAELAFNARLFLLVATLFFIGLLMWDDGQRTLKWLAPIRHMGIASIMVIVPMAVYSSVDTDCDVQMSGHRASLFTVLDNHVCLSFGVVSLKPVDRAYCGTGMTC